MIFPVVCPMCRADSGRRIIPQSPEVETFCCGHCHHQWSEPAPASVAQPRASAPSILDKLREALFPHVSP